MVTGRDAAAPLSSVMNSHRLPGAPSLRQAPLIASEGAARGLMPLAAPTHSASYERRELKRPDQICCHSHRVQHVQTTGRKWACSP
jgi:hypothetical protein